MTTVLREIPDAARPDFALALPSEAVARSQAKLLRLA
jgi:hypothetical protein